MDFYKNYEKIENNICNPKNYEDKKAKNHSKEGLKSLFTNKSKPYSDTASSDRKSSPSEKSAGSERKSKEEDKSETQRTLMKLIGHPKFTDPPVKRLRKDKRYSTLSTPSIKTEIFKKQTAKANRVLSHLSCGPEVQRYLETNVKKGKQDMTDPKVKQTEMSQKMNSIFESGRRSYYDQQVPKTRSLFYTKQQAFNESQQGCKMVFDKDDNYNQHLRLTSDQIEKQMKTVPKKSMQRPESQSSNRLSQSIVESKRDFMAEWNALKQDKNRYEAMRNKSLQNQSRFQTENRKDTVKLQARPYLSYSQIKPFNQSENQKIIHETQFKNLIKEQCLRSKSLDRRCENLVHQPQPQPEMKFFREQQMQLSPNKISTTHNARNFPPDEHQSKLQTMPVKFPYDQQIQESHNKTSTIQNAINVQPEKRKSDLQTTQGNSMPAKTGTNKEITKSSPENFQTEQNKDSEKFQQPVRQTSNVMKQKTTDAISQTNQESNSPVVKSEQSSTSVNMNRLSDEKKNKSSQIVQTKSFSTKKPKKPTQLNININVKPICCSHQNTDLSNMNSSGSIQNWMFDCNTEDLPAKSPVKGANDEISKNMKCIEFGQDVNHLNSVNGNNNSAPSKLNELLNTTQNNNYLLNDRSSVEKRGTTYSNTQKNYNNFVSNPENNQPYFSSLNNYSMYYNTANDTSSQNFYRQRLFPKPGVTDCHYSVPHPENTSNSVMNPNIREKSRLVDSGIKDCFSSVQPPQNNRGNSISPNVQERSQFFGLGAEGCHCSEQKPQNNRGNCAKSLNIQEKIQKLGVEKCLCSLQNHRNQGNLMKRPSIQEKTQFTCSNVKECCCSKQIETNSMISQNFQEKSPTVDDSIVRQPRNQKSNPKIKIPNQLASRVPSQQIQQDHSSNEIGTNHRNTTHKNENGDTVINIPGFNQQKQTDYSKEILQNCHPNLQTEVSSPVQRKESRLCECCNTDSSRVNQNTELSPEQNVCHSRQSLSHKSKECMAVIKQNEKISCSVLTTQSKCDTKEEQQECKKHSVGDKPGPPQIKIIYSSNISGETSNSVIQPQQPQEISLLTSDSKTQTVRLKNGQDQTVTVINIQTCNDGGFGKDNIRATVETIKNSSDFNINNNDSSNTTVKKPQSSSHITTKISSQKFINAINDNNENIKPKSYNSQPQLTKPPSSIKTTQQQSQKQIHEQQSKPTPEQQPQPQKQQQQQKQRFNNINNQPAPQPFGAYYNTSCSGCVGMNTNRTPTMPKFNTKFTTNNPKMQTTPTE